MALHHRKPGPTDRISLLSLLALQLCIPCMLFADSVVVINEIMYHPRAGDPEWIELYNQMGTHVDLSGWSLTGAVEYTFPDGTILPAGLYLVVASSVEADPENLPVPVLGPFDGKLSNGGEEIRLTNNSGRVMSRVRYGDRDDWPVAPDGSGVTLAKIDPTDESETASNWTWSDRVNGTPKGPNFDDATPLPRPLRFNEICPAGDSPFFVEITNVGTEPVTLTDAWLEIQGSQDVTHTFDDDLLDSGQHLVVTQSDLGFAPISGDRLVLGSSNGRVSDAVRVSETMMGRHPAGTGPWLVLASPTPGQANQVELCTDIVINEIMYHPQTLPREETTETISLFGEEVPTKILVPQDDHLGRQWTGGSEPFDDGAWVQSPGTGVGYEAGSGYEPYIDTDVRAEMQGRYHTVYIRIPFEVTDSNALATLTLNLRYDDGFLAFLNGTLIASGNMAICQGPRPGTTRPPPHTTIRWQRATRASTSRIICPY